MVTLHSRGKPAFVLHTFVVDDFGNELRLQVDDYDPTLTDAWGQALRFVVRHREEALS